MQAYIAQIKDNYPGKDKLFNLIRRMLTWKNYNRPDFKSLIQNIDVAWDISVFKENENQANLLEQFE